MPKLLFEILLGIGIFALPLAVGLLFDYESVSFNYLAGQLVLWAVFQVVAVPVIFYRADFNTLVWIYTVLAVILAALSFGVLFHKGRRRKAAGNRKPRHRRLSPFLIIALVIIGCQMLVYIFGMHLDEDDARWIAEANDALTKNRMLLHNPATGEYIGRFSGEMIKDIFSPWCMYMAWLSRVTGIKAAVLAHTVYPPILLGLSYSAYYETGKQLFGNRKRHEKGIFLLMVAVINLFYGGNNYTQSVFSLTRIWQGKAVVASVMLPTIAMLFMRIQRPRTRRRADARQGLGMRWGKPCDWILLIATGMGCCLCSGMGISMGLLLIGVYGAYLAVRMIISTVRGSGDAWPACVAKIALLAGALMPSIVYGMCYVWLNGHLTI